MLLEKLKHVGYSQGQITKQSSSSGGEAETEERACQDRLLPYGSIAVDERIARLRV
jgi:hypothetical protein